MFINLSEILSTKNKIENIKASIELQSFILDGTEYEFSFKSPVEFTISNAGQKKVFIVANAKVSLMIPCSRCLEKVETFFDIHFEKEIDFNYSEEDRARELDDTNYISGYNLDVDLLVYDEILIDFPMRVLCKNDCKGICNVCGLNLNKGTCDCETTALDPRMSVIRDIFKNSK